MANQHTHKHKCSYCGHVWEHADSCALSCFAEEAHTCSHCGVQQWDKYEGNQVASERQKNCASRPYTKAVS